MIDIWNLEWVNHNSVRAYPLSSDATRINITNDFTLPDDVIVGLSISIAGSADSSEEITDVTNFYLSCVGIGAKSCVFEITYDSTIIAKAVCDFSEAKNNTIPQILSLAPQNNTKLIGYIAINNLLTLQNMPNGYWYFDKSGGKLDPDVIKTQPTGIGIIKIITDNSTELINGSGFSIKAGSNITLGTSIDNNEDIITITGATPTAEAIAEAIPDAITSINGITPDDTGNILFVAGECMDINLDSGGNALYFSETCSSPCCGCSELEILVNKVEQLNTAVNNIQAYLTSMSNKLYFEERMLNG